jgi:hypothetical protein
LLIIGPQPTDDYTFHEGLSSILMARPRRCVVKTSALSPDLDRWLRRRETPGAERRAGRHINIDGPSQR